MTDPIDGYTICWGNGDDGRNIVVFSQHVPAVGTEVKLWPDATRGVWTNEEERCAIQDKAVKGTTWRVDRVVTTIRETGACRALQHVSVTVYLSEVNND